MTKTRTSRVKSKTKTKRETEAARERKAQYETDRAFAAEAIVQRMLEDGNGPLTFDSPEDQLGLGSCELYGTEDARDADGVGGAWAIVRFYIPNLDLDVEIEK